MGGTESLPSKSMYGVLGLVSSILARGVSAGGTTVSSKMGVVTILLKDFFVNGFERGVLVILSLEANPTGNISVLQTSLINVHTFFEISLCEFHLLKEQLITTNIYNSVLTWSDVSAMTVLAIYDGDNTNVLKMTHLPALLDCLVMMQDVYEVMIPLKSLE